MPDPRNPHNSYFYKPLDQAAPLYVPPSNSTKRILPVPQEAGQGSYDYGMPGQARPFHIPSSSERKQPIPEPSTMKKETYRDRHVAMSDRHSKEQIEKLSTRNQALTDALDQAQAAHGGESNLPPTEYPKLPSHTNFPSPAATRVAEQSAALMQPAPQPQPMAAQPQMGPPAQPLVAAPQMPRSQGFNVGNGPPDLSQLDEAYRRLGASQGG